MAQEGNDLVSEAIDQLQESGAGSAPAATSRDGQGVQEQKPTEAAQPDLDALKEQIRKETAERVMREEQSKRDRMLHQMQMQYEAELNKRAEELARQRAEQTAVQNMDDEEFGRYTKQQLAEQAKQAEIARQKQAAAEEVTKSEMLKERQRILARIPSKELLDEFLRQENEKVHSFEEFKDFSVEFLADIKAQEKAAKLAAEAQKAQHNDNLAQQAALAAPVVSTGTYAPSTRLSTDDLLSQGIDEAFEQKRKR